MKKQNTKLTLLSSSGVSILLCLSLYTNPVYSDGTPAESSLTYYSLGGGEPVMPPVVFNRPERVGFGPGFKLPSLCDLWEYKHLDDILDRYGDMVTSYVEGQLDALGQTIMTNLVANAEGLLASTIQRAMPGLYSYTQSVHGQLGVKISSAKRSCEEVFKEARTSPVSPWKKYSRVAGWQEAMGITYQTSGAIQIGGGSNHILDAEEAVRESDGNASIEWVGGPAGGLGDPPIRLVEDLVKAGGNILNGRSLRTQYDDDDFNDIDLPNDNPLIDTTVQKASLTTYFPSTADAVEWATLVVGEQVISTCAAASCDPSTQAGIGLQSAYFLKRQEYLLAWSDIIDDVNAGATITIDAMRTVSGGRVHIVQEVIESLYGMVPQDAAMYIDRLASDAAVSDTVEKAFTVIRIFETAGTIPEVLAYEKAQSEVENITSKLRKEIQNMIMEIQISQSLTSKTASALITRNRIQQESGSQVVETGTRGAYAPLSTSLSSGEPMILEEVR